MNVLSSVVAVRGRIRSWLRLSWSDVCLGAIARLGIAPRLGGGLVAVPGARLHAFVNSPRVHTAFVYTALVALFMVIFDSSLYAADGPWETGVQALCESFTGIIGQGLSLIAIIIGGLLFAFGEGGSKSQIAGLVFGAGLVLQAPAFLSFVGLMDSTDCTGGGVVT